MSANHHNNTKLSDSDGLIAAIVVGCVAFAATLAFIYHCFCKKSPARNAIEADNPGHSRNAREAGNARHTRNATETNNAENLQKSTRRSDVGSVGSTFVNVNDDGEELASISSGDNVPNANANANANANDDDKLPLLKSCRGSANEIGVFAAYGTNNNNNNNNNNNTVHASNEFVSDLYYNGP